MAARQGLGAQISQASEDAKQKILSHAPLKSSWFSNLNTTCTIKSAPPRTPEVLSLLSLKSGWLWKRNEQHVWQARWCCVVPHTFLYYFDAHASASRPPPPLTPEQQASLNEAIKNSSNRPHSGPRQSFNVFGEKEMKEKDGAAGMMGGESFPPAGIIDLECYTSVHRSTDNELLLELAGDDAVNPDLRSFYFFCHDEQEGADWTQALLQTKFSNIFDELQAFREVAGGFASQLQELHSDLDFTRQELEHTQDECYSVRSQAEETRRTCWKLVREVLDATATSTSTTTTTTTNETKIASARQAYRRDLEQARDLGTVVPAVQILCDYTRVLEEARAESLQRQEWLQTELEHVSTLDATKVKELQTLLQTKESDWNAQRSSLQQQISTLQQALLNCKKETDDAQQQITSQKMEMNMYQNSTKQRLGELLAHKKILKREVIDLRQKLDEVSSELSLLKHTAKTSLETVESERKKSELLERYVERMESQVKVQQNMMEIMSSSASCVAHMNGGGTSVHSFTLSRGHHSEAPRLYPHATIMESADTSPRTNLNNNNDGGNNTVEFDNESEIQREHVELLQRARQMVVLQDEEKNQNQVVVDAGVEEDAKSHMSELTEDRTQKHFYAQFGPPEQQSPSMVGISRRKQASATPKRLPSYIGVGGGGGRRNGEYHTRSNNTPGSTSRRLESRYQDEQDDDNNNNNGNNPKLDTIMSTAMSLPPQRSNNSGRHGLTDEKSVNSTSKLSVAQRARLQADEQSCNSVRVKIVRRSNSNTENSSLLGSIGRSLSGVIDQSVLGIPSSSEESEDLSSEHEPEERRYAGKAQSDTGVSEAVSKDVVDFVVGCLATVLMHVLLSLLF